MTKSLSKTHTTGLPSYPSMGACAGATGIPISLIRRAKRGGCTAFDQASRVHLAPLLAWLFAGENTETADWKQRLQRAQALAAENRTAAQRGDLIDGKAWTDDMHKVGGAFRGLIFEQIDYAPMKLAAAGEDVPKNREVLRDILWDLYEKFRATMLPAVEALQKGREDAQRAILNPTAPELETNHENETEDKK